MGLPRRRNLTILENIGDKYLTECIGGQLKRLFSVCPARQGLWHVRKRDVKATLLFRMQFARILVNHALEFPLRLSRIYSDSPDKLRAIHAAPASRRTIPIPRLMAARETTMLTATIIAATVYGVPVSPSAASAMRPLIAAPVATPREYAP